MKRIGVFILCLAFIALSCPAIVSAEGIRGNAGKNIRKAGTNMGKVKKGKIASYEKKDQDKIEDQRLGLRKPSTGC